MSFKRPALPERFSSRLAAPVRKELDTIKIRKVSATSTITAKSSVSGFLEAQIMGLEADLDYVKHYRQGLEEVARENVVAKRDLEEETSQLEDEDLERKKQLVVLKKQRKILEEDLLESGFPERTEEAYAETMAHKVMRSTAKMNKSCFNQSAFRKSVEAYYDASRVVEGEAQAHCAVFGWMGSRLTRAAHIVPKALETQELAYLFGVGDVVLSDPRNGMQF